MSAHTVTSRMISLTRIYKQYGRQILFVDASFQLNPGETVGLVGPNGSGKTTLFRLITGEEVPDEGGMSRRARGARCWTRRFSAAAASATCITSSSGSIRR